MKKLIAIVAAAALTAGAFAEGFKLDGFLRAGFNSTLDDDSSVASTETWLAGDYFGGSTRSRLNLGWSNEGDTAGAFVRLQYTGAAESWALDSVKYANVWAKPFDGKLILAVGKVQDNYIGSDGWEGFSFLDGNSGFFAGVSPVEGLVIGGGAVVDYLSDDADKNHKTDKKAAYAGAKYANDKFSVAAGYEFAGALYANVNISAVEALSIALEAAYVSDDAYDNGFADKWGYTSELTFVEQVEYTGIENLTLGLVSYQFVNNNDISTEESNIVVAITPAVRYEINDQFAASLESTVNVSSWDEDKLGAVPDTYATIVPAFHIKAAKGAEISIWGVVSTDTDQAKHQAGIGGIFKF